MKKSGKTVSVFCLILLSLPWLARAEDGGAMPQPGDHLEDSFLECDWPDALNESGDNYLVLEREVIFRDSNHLEPTGRMSAAYYEVGQVYHPDRLIWKAEIAQDRSDMTHFMGAPIDVHVKLAPSDPSWDEVFQQIDLHGGPSVLLELTYQGTFHDLNECDLTERLDRL